jgi:hypothetical protein
MMMMIPKMVKRGKRSVKSSKTRNCPTPLFLPPRRKRKGGNVSRRNRNW